MRLSYKWKTILAGTLLVVFLLVAANYYLGLGLWGRHAKQALLVVLLVGVIYAAFFSPTRDEMRAHRAGHEVR